MMQHAYYRYTREELFRNSPKIPVQILPDNAAVFRALAEEMADEIARHNEKGERTVFICPVGPTGQYPYFVELVNERKLSFTTSGFLTWTSTSRTTRRGFRSTTR